MKKLLYTIFILTSLTAGHIYAEPNTQIENTEACVNDIDFKNVLAKVDDIVILRSFESSFWGKDPNSRKSYLEAYDIQTGKLVWCHSDYGMIGTFIIVDDTLIYRNYNHITAVDVSNGSVIWTKKTKGQYSTIAGE